MPVTVFDAIDHRILATLQRNGRISNVDLADEVGLSPSPCLRRVKLLEEAGAVAGYQARLDREAIGLGVTVFVAIKLNRHHDEGQKAFREAVLALPDVVSCHIVSGEADFLLEVVATDLKAYQGIILDTLLKLPNVSDIRSNFVIQSIKANAPLPLGHLGRAATGRDGRR